MKKGQMELPPGLLYSKNYLSIANLQPVIFKGRRQTVLIACEQFFECRFDLNPLRIGLGVFRACRTADYVNHGAPELITSRCELGAPLGRELLALRKGFPFADLCFRETRIPDGVVPEMIGVPRFAAG